MLSESPMAEWKTNYKEFRNRQS